MGNRFGSAIRLVLDAAARDGFRVALIGGLAMPFHGVQRATGDVDFLVEGHGSDPLHAALLAAGFRCLHRSNDAANYASMQATIAPVDVLYARRPRALAMLERATLRHLADAELDVLVVDAEAIIGLKLQGIANAPSRRPQDEADILALWRERGARMDSTILRDYYELFGRSAEIETLISDTKAR